MPRLRSLSGADIIKILESFGFEVISIKGSHHKLRRIVNEQQQTLHVPVHGPKNPWHPAHYVLFTSKPAPIYPKMN